MVITDKKLTKYIKSVVVTFAKKKVKKMSVVNGE